MTSTLEMKTLRFDQGQRFRKVEVNIQVGTVTPEVLCIISELSLVYNPSALKNAH